MIKYLLLFFLLLNVAFAGQKDSIKTSVNLIKGTKSDSNVALSGTTRKINIRIQSNGAATLTDLATLSKNETLSLSQIAISNGTTLSPESNLAIESGKSTIFKVELKGSAAAIMVKLSFETQAEGVIVNVVIEESADPELVCINNLNKSENELSACKTNLNKQNQTLDQKKSDLNEALQKYRDLESPIQECLKEQNDLNTETDQAKTDYEKELRLVKYYRAYSSYLDSEISRSSQVSLGTVYFCELTDDSHRIVGHGVSMAEALKDAIENCANSCSRNFKFNCGVNK